MPVTSVPVLAPAAGRETAIVAELGRRLLATGLDDLTRRLAAAIRSTVDGYGDGGIVEPAELYASCRTNLARQLQVLVGEIPPGSDPDDAAAATGRRRAQQGLPLESLLQSYRLGGRVLWEGLVRETRTGATPVDMDRLLDAATWVWEVIDRHSGVVSGAYRAEERLRRRRDLRRQQVLLDALVDGGGSDPAVAREAAAVLEPGPELGVVVLGEAGLVEAAAALRGCCAGRVAVSPVVDGFADVATAHRLAELALRTLPASYVGVVTVPERLPEALLAGSPDTARLLVEHVLGPVLALGDRERETLLATLAAVLAAGGSPTHAAVTLFCHRNTVINRVSRIEELTGRSLCSPQDRLALALAQLALALP